MAIVTFLGRLHPLVVHFPVAFVLAAAVAEAIAWRRPTEAAAGAARFLVAAAALTAPPVALLGLAFAYGTTYEADLVWYFWWHRATGLAVAALAVAAWIARGRNPAAHRVLLGLAALAVGAAGHFGGALTWGPDHLFR